MGSTRWQCIRYYSDVHVIPVCGNSIHTIPMCWCKPNREQVTTRIGAHLVSHNNIHNQSQHREVLHVSR
jgi:hypothetical protein